MRYVLIIWGLLLGPTISSAQEVSPYTFAGIRLPLTGEELKAKIKTPPKCIREKPEQVTTCMAYNVYLTGADSGVYQIYWEVNEPTGQVSAVSFTRSTALTEAYVDSLNRRWGPHKPKPYNGRSAWWGKPDTNWLVDIETRERPGTRKLTLRNSAELKAVSKRVSELRQQRRTQQSPSQ